ncbi:MAG: DUF5060 domain-containing protein [Bryobacteraceae bacterium]
MKLRLAVLLLTTGIRLPAQTVCGPTPAYSPCEIQFELSVTEAAAHPDPGRTVQLRAEFRSPRHRTFLMPAFWDGGAKLTIRFSPIEAGAWDYRLTSNIESWNGKEGHFTATPSDAPGFVQPANVHHFSYTENNKPHLWCGDIVPPLDRERFEQFVTARVQEKVNHLRITLDPTKFDPAYYRDLDQRVLFINRKGVTTDIMLAGGNNQLTKAFPEREQRERYVQYIVSRYSAFNITWQGVESFETYDSGRELLKEIGTYLKNMDPYGHPRSTGALTTSAPLIDDGWMTYLTYRSSDDQVGAIEHQLYGMPAINDFGGGNDDAARKRLWNATMNGQYPAATGPRMKAWFDFFSDTRYWELEPFFDVEGGRGVALGDVEYIIYVEKPGAVDVQLEKHGYDVAWFNPINGEAIELKNFKGDRFLGDPPDRAHDWVLHISREGKKESMLKEYKFETAPPVLQEVESNPEKVPFTIDEPSSDIVYMHDPSSYSAKLKKQTRATRAMMYLWTGEVTADGQSYRVLGTGSRGTLQLSPDLARRFPASMHLRLTGMNAYGKVYVSDRNYQLAQ